MRFEFIAKHRGTWPVSWIHEALDPANGARALLQALDYPSPPLHLILGELGLEVVERYETQRMGWTDTSRLRP